MVPPLSCRRLRRERQVCQISGQENCAQADTDVASRPPSLTALDPLKADGDQDGLDDAQEHAIGTGPDSNGDGTSDGDEQEDGNDPLEDERNTARKLVEGGGFVRDTGTRRCTVRGVTSQTQSQAESIIGDILRKPKVVDRGDRVVDAYDASGRGVRLRRDTGKFQGFLDLARRRTR